MRAMWDVTAADGSTFEVNSDDISDWADIRYESTPERGRQYTAYAKDTELAIGVVRFLLDFPEANILTITDLAVEPDFQGRGVALALLAAVHAGYPDHQVSPGAPSALGREFIAHILQTEPEVGKAGALIHPSVADLGGDGAHPQAGALDASGDSGGAA